MSFIMFNMSYLFSVLILVFLVMVMMIMHLFSLIYLKYLVVLVYSSGIVVFILYISCMCWNVNKRFSNFFLCFVVVNNFIFDNGLYLKLADVSEWLWMFLFFSMVFSVLVTMYSLNLFKVSGSLRF